MKDGEQIWILGRMIHRGAWVVGGAFKTEKEANVLCTSSTEFIGPLIVGKRLPQNKVKVWPGAYYPRAVKVKEK